MGENVDNSALQCFVTDLLGDVQAESVHDVSEEEQVDLAFAIPVVDVADVLNLSLVNLKKEDDNLFITELLFCSIECKNQTSSN